MKKNHLLTAIAAMLAIIFCMASCKKDAVHQPGNPAKVNVSHTGSIPDSMVLTPTGLMPKSQIHLVENGFHLEINNGHVLKIKTSSGEWLQISGRCMHPLSTKKTPPKTMGVPTFKI